MEKQELIEKLKEEMQQNYVRFERFDSVIVPEYSTQWQKAVKEFYADYKGGLSEFQQDWNIHCKFVRILEEELLYAL